MDRLGPAAGLRGVDRFALVGAVAIDRGAPLIVGEGRDALAVHLEVVVPPAGAPRGGEDGHAAGAEGDDGVVVVDKWHVHGAIVGGDGHHLTAGHPAQRVDGVDDVGREVRDGAAAVAVVVGPGLELVEAGEALVQRPPLGDRRPATAQHLDVPPVEPHHGQAIVAARVPGERLGLIGSDGGRFFHEDVDAQLQQVHHDVVQVLRRHDHVDRVGLFARDELAIVAIAPGDAVLVGRRLQPLGVQFGDADQVNVGHRRERRVVGDVGQTAGAHHSYPHRIDELDPRRRPGSGNVSRDEGAGETIC